MPPSEHKGLYEEHQELAQVLQETGRLLKRRGCTHKEVDGQIWRLAEFIESHFAREENDGYMAESLTRAPHLTIDARRLLAEHAELLEDAKKLQMLARFGVESDAWWRQVEHDFQRLQERLLAHEHAENRLLHEANHPDAGATD